MTLLLVEDEDIILDGLKFCLEKEGYQILCAPSGNDALEILKDNTVHLMILDINLPDINGTQLFRKIKQERDIPTIFLTANDLEASIVEALELGADDYITKPFKIRELISRIHSVLRRSNSFNSDILQVQNIRLNTKDASVYKNEEKILLTALEYKILLILFQNPNKVFTRENILASIWDTEEAYVNDNTLTVYMKRIREKIEDDPSNPKVILTVRGMGYKLVL